MFKFYDVFMYSQKFNLIQKRFLKFKNVLKHYVMCACLRACTCLCGGRVKCIHTATNVQVQEQPRVLFLAFHIKRAALFLYITV